MGLEVISYNCKEHLSMADTNVLISLDRVFKVHIYESYKELRL